MKPRSNMTRIAIAIIACCPLGLAVNNASAGDKKAIAYLQGCDPDSSISGEVKLKQKINKSRSEKNQGVSEVEVKVKIEGARKWHEDTEHGVHIHEFGDCSSCGAAGGHFDPGVFGEEGPNANHPYHMGDLPNITIKKDGKGEMKTKTSRVTLTPGNLSVFDKDGSAIIVHVEPDTFCPDGADSDPIGRCAGGARLACGIIEPD